MDFERIRQIFDAATLKRPELREAYVVAQCGEDPEMLREVLALLESHDRAPEAFLTTTSNFRLPEDFEIEDL